MMNKRPKLITLISYILAAVVSAIVYSETGKVSNMLLCISVILTIRLALTFIMKDGRELPILFGILEGVALMTTIIFFSVFIHN